ncbi:MAG: basic amino acid ABC transporter substrate-binding protein [Christensenellales bacterium]|jgi:ABC-type amino acid transport substrate-binding protein
MKKILAMVLALSMLLCGVAFAETLKVGTNPEFAPFEYVGDDGNVTGIDIDIMQAICEKIGYELQLETMSFDALIPALISGQIQASISGMTITEERAQSVLFSNPYFSATQVIIVPAEGAVVTCEADLEGKKIGVCMGYTGDLYVTDSFPTATIERYEKGMDAVQDLANGRLDAVVLDEAPAKVLADQAGTLTVLEDRLSDEQYGIAMPLDATELCEKINAALAELEADGTLQACIDKYKSTEQ